MLQGSLMACTPRPATRPATRAADVVGFTQRGGVGATQVKKAAHSGAAYCKCCCMHKGSVAAPEAVVQSDA